MLARRCAFPIALIVTLVAPSARADETATGVAEIPAATVRVRSRVRGVFEERRSGEVEWRALCAVPCEAEVDPSADHQLSLVGEAAIPISVHLTVGHVTVVEVSPSQRGARTGLMVVGAASVGIGLFVALIAGTGSAIAGARSSNACDDSGLYKNCDAINADRDRQAKAEQASAETTALGGLAAAALGALVLTLAAVLVPTKATVRMRSYPSKAAAAFAPRDRQAPLRGARFVVPVFELTF